MNLKKLILHTITEGVHHDGEIMDLLDRARSNLKLNSATVSNLKVAGELARTAGDLSVSHGEDSQEYKGAHDDLVNHLIDWTEGQHEELSHPNPNEHAQSMFKVAKAGIHTWEGSPHFDKNNKDFLKMTGMFLSDAGDHVDLAIHAANNDKEGFKHRVSRMDTAPREMIPHHIYDHMMR